MTASRSTLITRRGIAPRTLRVGLDEDGDLGTKGRSKCWPRICIFVIMSLWKTCLANCAQISFINFSTYCSEWGKPPQFSYGMLYANVYWPQSNVWTKMRPRWLLLQLGLVTVEVKDHGRTMSQWFSELGSECWTPDFDFWLRHCPHHTQ
jgi:hypothetical protein